MDLDYLSYAVLMGVFGIVGLTATAAVSPNIFALATCNCIPSPLARIQELSIILLAFAAILVPVGMTRRGSLAVALGMGELPSGRTYTEPPMRSGELFALGAALIVTGMAVVIPSVMLLQNFALVGEGAAIIVLGFVLAYRGGRSKTGHS
ncbi:MAG TPA: hypothetical protein VLU99_08255 [Nitrososphaerales archaeon]|nr:hypothetical protein [Nitrososphaerales archaeon]HUK75771.1 hypothetical protein [Nitrososphaerales archaeon]